MQMITQNKTHTAHGDTQFVLYNNRNVMAGQTVQLPEGSHV